MYAFTVKTEIDAPPARVWRALCDPAEVVQCDSGVEFALGPQTKQAVTASMRALRQHCETDA